VGTITMDGSCDGNAFDDGEVGCAAPGTVLAGPDRAIECVNGVAGPVAFNVGGGVGAVTPGAVSAATAGCNPGPENMPASNAPAAIVDTTPKERRREIALEGMIGPLKPHGITASIVATVDAKVRLDLSVYPCQGVSFVVNENRIGQQTSPIRIEGRAPFSEHGSHVLLLEDSSSTTNPGCYAYPGYADHARHW